MPSRRVLVSAALAAGCLCAGAGAAAVRLGGGDGDGRAATSAAATGESAVRPAAARADRAVRAAALLAPLRRLTPPDVLVDLPHPAPPARVTRLRRLSGVRAVVVLDRGTVRVAGRRVDLVGVNPGRVRPFTPRFTAVSTQLWRSVAAGELTLSYARAAGMRGLLGRTVAMVRGRDGAPVRVGAFASIGIGHVEGMVSHVAARRWRLPRDRSLLVSAPKLSVATLRADVRAAFGTGAVVHVLRPKAVDQAAISDYAKATIPSAYLRLYRAAASTCPGLPWTVLAAIGAVETGHGADSRTSSKGAMGPMQFLPSTFAAYAVDGDGDGVANIQDPADAVYSAAHYLCLWGAGRGGQSLYVAIWAYNHADWYVREVLRLAVAYA